jgi:hypothetical protein
MDAPSRTTQVDTQCWCVILTDGAPDWPCGMHTAGPDAPFCYQCEDRHPDVVDRSRISVRTF